MSDRRVIGDAAEFYRVRVIRLDEHDGPDLEWRDDILYRTPPTQEPAEAETHRVEAVRLDDDTVVTEIARFPDADSARAFVERLEVDLAGMTKSAFEARHFPAE